MKKITLLVALAASMLAACSRVEPGHVGVKVNRYGSSSGVEAKALPVGGYWTGFGSSIEEYPVFTNNYAWSKTDEKNEEFSFQDKNGLIVQADVATAYRVDPTKAPILYQKYRTGMDGLLAGPLRNAVRSALVDTASNMSVEDIYGPKKSELIAKALAKVRAYFEPQGLHVEQLYWAGPIRIPSAILDRINARAQNEQAAIAARAQVETIKAEAEAAVAKANGEAESTTVKAKAEAEAIRIKADAVAQNPKIVDYTYAQAWDGAMPSTVYCSAGTPCLGALGK